MTNLLKVLDMSEDSPEQYGWLLSTIREHKACCPADLAFRLRDEAGVRFYTAMRIIYDVITNDSNPDGFSIWWMLNTKPIHWIIAALIAKDKENE